MDRSTFLPDSCLETLEIFLGSACTVLAQPPQNFLTELLCARFPNPVSKVPGGHTEIECVERTRSFQIPLPALSLIGRVPNEAYAAHRLGFPTGKRDRVRAVVRVSKAQKILHIRPENLASNHDPLDLIEAELVAP